MRFKATGTVVMLFLSVSGCASPADLLLPDPERGGPAATTVVVKERRAPLSSRETLIAISARSRSLRGSMGSLTAKGPSVKRTYNADGSLKRELVRSGSKWVERPSTLPLDLAARPLASYLPSGGEALSRVTPSLKIVSYSIEGIAAIDTLATDVGYAASTLTSDEARPYGSAITYLNYDSSTNEERFDHIVHMEAYSWRLDWDSTWVGEELIFGETEVAAGILVARADSADAMGASLRAAPWDGSPTGPAGGGKSAADCGPDGAAVPRDILGAFSVFRPANCDIAEQEWQGSRMRSNFFGVLTVFMAAIAPPSGPAMLAVYIGLKAESVGKGHALNTCYKQLYGPP